MRIRIRTIKTLIAVSLLTLPSLAAGLAPARAAGPVADPYADPGAEPWQKDNKQKSPAVRLLWRMMRAEMKVPFAGREATFSVDRGGATEQRIKRDPDRGLRRESSTPGGVVFVDDRIRSYVWHRQANRLIERDSMLREMQRRIKQVQNDIAQGKLRADVVGSDTVAGRTAEIVQVAPPPGTAAPSRRFWIDRATGLRLKIEERDSQGRLIASSELLEVDFTPQFSDTDFSRPEVGPGVVVIQDRRRSFDSVAGAAKAAGFAIRTPRFLPDGFSLHIVDVLPMPPGGKGTMVVQRFSNGLNFLSLFQSDSGPPKDLDGKFPRDENGFVTLPRGLRLYPWKRGSFSFALMGSLEETDLKRIADSVR